ncbi:MAG: hypothetical protein O8C55_13125 [Candidatus Methanoperedens sp.]|nr:hypothetical protein [Candidatus Methanoperedens sp.]
MTAHPSSGSATVTVNSFNTSLPAGQVLVNITASSTNGNNVNFTVSTLSQGRNYIIKKGGSSFATKQADSSGRIEFGNSEWSEGTFTIQEGSSPEGSISGRLSRINETPIAGATVLAVLQQRCSLRLIRIIRRRRQVQVQQHPGRCILRKSHKGKK